MLASLRGHGPTGEIAGWAWPIQLGSDYQALTAAASLLLLGLIAVIWRGARTRPVD